MENTEKKENISTEQSLKIIAETMERSRMTIAKNSGKPLILWGFLVAVTALVIHLLWTNTNNCAWNLLWFAMAAIGFAATFIISKNREHAPLNEMGRILGKIWMWFGIITTGFYLLIWIAYFIIKYCNYNTDSVIHVNLTLIIVIAMGLCGIISGVVMKMRSIVACCATATFLSALVALLMPGQVLVFVILGIVGLLVPGLILQKKARG